MFMRRVADALRRQEWTTILIEFVLVIAGVLVALQLDQWKDELAEDAEEKRLLLAVYGDIEQDVLDLENTQAAMDSIMEFGATAITFLEEGDCSDACWPILVAFFHASQWTDVELNKATYEEIQRAGLPSDPALRRALAMYYALNQQSVRVFADMPPYRETVRSLIPMAMQTHLWQACFRIEGRHQFLIADCESPASETDVRAILDELRADAEVKKSLNFWLSTVAVVKSTLDEQIDGAKSVMDEISNFVSGQQ